MKKIWREFVRDFIVSYLDAIVDKLLRYECLHPEGGDKSHDDRMILYDAARIVKRLYDYPMMVDKL